VPILIALVGLFLGLLLVAVTERIGFMTRPIV
jgi:hypothetical protein